MDIEALNTFLTLANTKNYTRTAAQLFVAQSTVTNRIHELEKELNIALFTRNNRSVELTVEGEQFKDYAEKVITLTNASLSEISSLHKYANHLRIGCSDSIYEGRPEDHDWSFQPADGAIAERYLRCDLHLSSYEKIILSLRGLQAG